MPHIYTKKFKIKPFADEVEFENVKFKLLARSLKRKNYYLVLTEFRNNEFFLEIHDRKDKILIKSEKSSRPSPTFLIHKAIDSFAKINNLEIIHSNLNLKESQHLIETEKPLKSVDYFQNFDFKNKEIEIEIGFGSGRHLLYQAKKNPNTIFIGLEIHKTSIEQVLKQIKINNLNNIFVVDFDARQFLEILPSNQIGKIFLHFPVPWDKKPHRRVLQPKFLKEVERVLKVNGMFELRTDSDNYFKYAKELFQDLNNFKIKFEKNGDIPVISKYESRWRNMNKNIYNFRLFKINRVDEISFADEVENEFEIKNSDKINNYLGRKILKKDWFINFQDIFEVNNNLKILSIVAGTYNYPNNKFLLLKINKIQYLIKKVFKLKTNFEINKFLKEKL
jgi:tRNA (guanine-N7-)-methyltransferase